MAKLLTTAGSNIEALHMHFRREASIAMCQSVIISSSSANTFRKVLYDFLTIQYINSICIGRQQKLSRERKSLHEPRMETQIF